MSTLFGGNFDLKDPGRILWKRKRAALTVFAFVYLGIVLRTVFERPTYQASTSVLLGPYFPPKRSLEELLTENFENGFLKGQLRLLKSPLLARRVVERLALTPETLGMPGSDPTELVRASVSITLDDETRTFTLRAESPRPAVARDVANAYADAYLEELGAQGNGEHRKSIQWLTGEIAQLKEKVETSEKALIDYIDRAGIVSAIPSDGTPEGTDSQDVVQSLRKEVVDKEMEVDALGRRYLPEHPRYRQAVEALESLKRRLGEEERRAIDQNKKRIEYEMLEREARLNKDLYALLVKKLKEADLSSGNVEGYGRVLEYAALPQVPVRPKVEQNLSVGFFIALLLGVMAAFFQEYLDRSIKTEDDVRRLLGLPVLAQVPRLPDRIDASRSGGVSVEDHTTVTEAFRMLRTALKFSKAGGPDRVLLVASTTSQEGKTVTVEKLGESIARTGSRVLLIDGDLRKPRLHSMLGVPREPGLTNLLVGELADPLEAVHPSHLPGLSLLPAGTEAPNPAELIEGHALRGIFERVRPRFDHVVVDSPPVALVADAQTLASAADAVVLVVQAGRCEFPAVVRTVESLKKANPRVVGALINKVRAGDDKYYYYYYYYDAPEEEATPVRRVVGWLRSALLG